MDRAQVIEINFMCYKFFLYFSGMSGGGVRAPLDPPLGSHRPPLIVSTFARCCVKSAYFENICLVLVWLTFLLSFVLGLFWHFDVTDASLL